MKKTLFRPILPLHLISLALLLTACVSTDVSAPKKDFSRAQGHFYGGNLQRAIDACDAIIVEGTRSFPKSDLVKTHQLRGECYKRLKNYSLARCDFETAERMAGTLGGESPQWKKVRVECSMAAGDTYMHEGSFRIADRTFAKLLDDSPPAELEDPLLYRRYICAVKLQKPDPEQYMHRIKNLWSFDVASLRKEFLGGSKAPVTRKTEPSRDRWSVSKFEVLPRARWNAAPTRANVTPMTTIRRITVHHTGNLWQNMDYYATANKIKAYQRFHQDRNGWADLGYHFIIDRAGRIWQGRDLRFQGAHAGNSQLNRGNIGVVLIGDYDQQTLYKMQKESLVSLLALLCREYRLSPLQIATHQELKITACPGKHLQLFVEQLRSGSIP